MTLPTAELLSRLAETLRSDIGPAVDDEYTRTQAFMAAVILERVGRQVALGPEHAAAERRDLAELFDDLASRLTAAPGEVPAEVPDAVPPEVTAAVETARAAGGIDALGAVIEALYRWGPDVPAAAEALARVRVALRRDIDRRMEIAR